ncbi:hypothetical protein CEXT_39041 [Caerostris extrusa]|uniref:Uncharacterized protein n=1 Tax=Caerostris extrusa TaxID=172846 RepID=A0AAV4TIJ7_CAEEX|nr:hypothetical protein CEXT_39041 [Caerostris extrusa]
MAFQKVRIDKKIKKTMLLLSKKKYITNTLLNRDIERPMIAVLKVLEKFLLVVELMSRNYVILQIHIFGDWTRLVRSIHSTLVRREEYEFWQSEEDRGNGQLDRGNIRQTEETSLADASGTSGRRRERPGCALLANTTRLCLVGDTSGRQRSEVVPCWEDRGDDQVVPGRQRELPSPDSLVGRRTSPVVPGDTSGRQMPALLANLQERRRGAEGPSPTGCALADASGTSGRQRSDQVVPCWTGDRGATRLCLVGDTSGRQRSDQVVPCWRYLRETEETTRLCLVAIPGDRGDNQVTCWQMQLPSGDRL